MMYRDYGFMGGFEWLFMIVFWAVIIWAIIALIRHFTGNGRHDGSRWDGRREEYRENYRERENYRDDHRNRSRENFDGNYLSRKNEYNDHDQEILKILKERYARGEITREEFEQKKVDLMTR